MSHQLTFAQLVNYDASQSGITVEVTLSLNGDRIGCKAKLAFSNKYASAFIDYEGKLYLSNYDE